jgi:hypothetical protein
MTTVVFAVPARARPLFFGACLPIQESRSSPVCPPPRIFSDFVLDFLSPDIL